MIYPTAAIIAVTLNCNSRCLMCNIWKNKIKNELDPKYYLKLPFSLRDINITGGEPFLRKDLIQIIKNIKKACPKARLVINTNGYLSKKIKADVRQLQKIDKNIAIRLSIDGLGNTHDKIRGIPNAFQKATQTLWDLKNLGVKDLGISFTLLEQNLNQLKNVYNFSLENRLEFSLTIATNSPIYFGDDKQKLRPKNQKLLKEAFFFLAKQHLQKNSPKEILRGWFVKKLYQYILTNKRPLSCNAGKGFFYMDSLGDIYTCHLKPWKLGNIKKQPIEKILANNKYNKEVPGCNSCWMICTVKPIIRKRVFRIILEAIKEKLKNEN